MWLVISASMAEWRAGAGSANAASRGAPIRIAGYGCCLLADRLEDWDSLRSCLDRAVTALVLYDQFCDWEADVAAGRWNAFVDRVTAAPQDRDRAPRNRAAVLTAMLTRDVITQHFDAAVSEARGAGAGARETGVPQLASFLEEWADATGAQGAS